MDDELLAKRAGGGDTRAFEELLKRHQDRVYSMALRYTGNQDDAFDISQEVFLKVWRALPGFKQEAKFSTWLYRIVMNVCTDHHRSSSKYQTVPLIRQEEEREAEPLDLPDETYSPERALMDADLSAALKKAVSGLREEFKQVFLMRELGDMSYTEIAAALHIEEGTVKSRLFRARKELQEMLKKSGNLPSVLASNHAKGGDKQ